jgi:pimeloyl-ACP methyl ester carboxylesterase
MNETSVIIDGIRSPLLEFGPTNSDEAVVFVHGNPGSIRDWALWHAVWDSSVARSQ